MELISELPFEVICVLCKQVKSCEIRSSLNPSTEKLFTPEKIQHLLDISIQCNGNHGLVKTMDNPDWHMIVTNYDHGMRNGIEYYYKNKDQLSKTIEYLNDVKNGKSTYYDEEGVCSVVHYKNGVLNGPYEIFRPYEKYTEYLNGLVHGKSIDVHDGLKVLSMFKRGKLHGSRYVYKSGKLMRISPYRNDMQHGETLSFQDGKITSLQYYNKGRMYKMLRIGVDLETKIYYTKEGRIEKKYMNGIPHSIIGYDVEDRYHGDYVTFRSDGKVSIRGQYQNGSRVGRLEYFNKQEVSDLGSM